MASAWAVSSKDPFVRLESEVHALRADQMRAEELMVALGAQQCEASKDQLRIFSAGIERLMQAHSELRGDLLSAGLIDSVGKESPTGARGAVV